MAHDYRSELQCAVRAAMAAGGFLRTAFHSAATGVDTQAEEQILPILTEAFPHYGYRGEELGLVSLPRDPDAHLWLIDPNDGTSAFEAGFRGAAVSIALLRDGRPVLGVVYAYSAPDDSGDLFTWAEGAGPLQRNGKTASPAEAPDTILVSQHADRNPRANAIAAAPFRLRAVPGIAYRLALVAAGEAQAGVSLNGPVGWDYAGGHALLLGAGMDLFDGDGTPVRYRRDGESHCQGHCFGGREPVVRKLSSRPWQRVLERLPDSTEPYPLCWPAPARTVSDPGLLSRAQGCLLGQLAGDALGGLVEFQNPSDIARRYPNGVRLLADGGTWNTLAGQPTDDSEMALTLARSIVAGGAYGAESAAHAYGWWHDSKPFDIGNATSAACSAAARAMRSGESPAAAARASALADTQANGALMRSSPLGLFACSADPGVAGALAAEDASLTHPHPVCRHANRIYVEALAHAIQSGAGPGQIYHYAVETARTGGAPESVLDAILSAATNPPADFTRQMGWALLALQNAFWQLLHAETMEQGIVNTIMSGGDTDTNAAIAGALLGAVHGRQGVPTQWLDRILTCRPIEGLPGVVHPRPYALWPVDALWLAERLVWSGQQADEGVW
jgi:ADP-ribosyl-[dinitrogen reductase] hydrolase